MSLPTELLDEIFSLLDPNDLCAMCLTHSSFLPVARRILYREVYAEEPSVALSVSKVLCEKPNLSANVRMFLVTVPETCEEEESATNKELDTATEELASKACEEDHVIDDANTRSLPNQSDCGGSPTRTARVQSGNDAEKCEPYDRIRDPASLRTASQGNVSALVTPTPFPELVCRAIGTMTRLKWLRIVNFERGCDVVSRLPDCAFQLEVFELVDNTGSLVDIVPFLDNQAGLLELALFAIDRHLDQLSAAAMPRLQRLHTTFERAKILVAERPIEDLQLCRLLGRFDLLEDLQEGFPSLSGSTGPIQVLKLELDDIQVGWPRWEGLSWADGTFDSGPGYVDVEILPEIAKHFPHLVDLSIHLKQEYWTQIKKLLTADESLSAFGSLPQLEVFELHSENWRIPPRRQAIKEIFERLGNVCVTLIHIDLSGNDWNTCISLSHAPEAVQCEIEDPIGDDSNWEEVSEEDPWDVMRREEDQRRDEEDHRREERRKEQWRRENPVIEPNEDWDDDEGDTRGITKRRRQQRESVKRRMAGASQREAKAVSRRQQGSRCCTKQSIGSRSAASVRARDLEAEYCQSHYDYEENNAEAISGTVASASHSQDCNPHTETAERDASDGPARNVLSLDGGRPPTATTSQNTVQAVPTASRGWHPRV